MPWDSTPPSGPELADSPQGHHVFAGSSGMRVRLSFQEELDRLQASLLEEGELVLRSLRACMNALRQQDVELADEVIAFDDDVDSTFLGIQQGIHELLARQTPVASDLRLVLAM